MKTKKIEEGFDMGREELEKECCICKRKVLNPFVTQIIRGSEKSVELDFCSFPCFEQDHITQTIDILMNYSDEVFAKKFKEIAELRLNVLENKDKMLLAQDRILE